MSFYNATNVRRQRRVKVTQLLKLLVKFTGLMIVDN